MRRRRVVKRELIPDAKYNSVLIARLINTIMERGKKSTAQRIVYGALDQIQVKKPEVQAIDVFTKALESRRGMIWRAISLNAAVGPCQSSMISIGAFRDTSGAAPPTKLSAE